MICPTCKQDLRPTAFYICKGRPNGFSSQCKQCTRDRMRKRYHDKGAKEGAPPQRPSVVDSSPTVITPEEQVAVLESTVHNLRQYIDRLEKDRLNEKTIVQQIMQLVSLGDNRLQPLPDVNSILPGHPGSPLLVLSDQHVGEVVDSEQVPGSANRYNIDIMRTRWRRVVEKTISACKALAGPASYDSITVAFGGDGMSGAIHEELSETNDADLNVAMLEYVDMIIWTIRTLREYFPCVRVPCVFGNHTRLTQKIRSKNAAYKSLDWLAYQMARRALQNDTQVHFSISTGADLPFTIHKTRFLLTHGDQFRGGDGIIGPLGPIFRGDNKKRARNSQIDSAYDVLVLGHFHQYRVDQRVICNGSLVGYNEYAARGNFPFEQPRQALVFVHPRYGVTWSTPIYAEYIE